MTFEQFVLENQPRNYPNPLPWFAKQMCNCVERGMRERKNLIIELPPRSWKSELLNVYRPAWWIQEGFIHNHSGLACNSAALAEKFVQAAGRLVPLEKSINRTSEWKLAADAQNLDLTYKGTGINGQLTGWGFDDITFDDLFKNGKEAKSPTVRTSIIDGVVSNGDEPADAGWNRHRDASSSSSRRHDWMVALNPDEIYPPAHSRLQRRWARRVAGGHV